jgi:hypothetical protein
MLNSRKPTFDNNQMIKNALERRLVELDKLEGSVGGNQALMEERRKTKKGMAKFSFC